MLGRTTVMTLGEWLEHERQAQGWTKVDMANHIKIGRTTYDNLVAGGEPEFGTIARIARAFNLPAWRVLQIAGMDLGLPQEPIDQAGRLAQALTQFPQLRHLGHLILDLPPDDLEAAVRYLEYLAKRKDEGTLYP